MRLPLLAAALSMTLGAVAAPIDTLARMRETGVATMGVREASGALSYRVGENAFAGFHVELCQRVLGDVRQKLGLPRLDIAYRPVSSQNRIPLLLNGSIDIECGSTTNTTQRQLDVAFAPTTFVEETRFAVKADSGIGSLAQIDGKRVSTTTGTTAVQVMRRKAQAAGVTFQAVFGKDHDDRSWPGSLPVRPTRPTTASSTKCFRWSRSRSCCARTTRRSSRRWTTACAR